MIIFWQLNFGGKGDIKKEFIFFLKVLPNTMHDKKYRFANQTGEKSFLSDVKFSRVLANSSSDKKI